MRRFPPEITGSPGFRAIFVVDVERVSTRCGYSMPVMSFERYRSALDEFVQKKGQSGMNDYRVYKNSFSIDGLPSNEINDVNCVGHEIWVATTRGLVCLPSLRENNKFSPIPKIHQILVNKEEIKPKDFSILPYQKNDVQISFHTLNYKLNGNIIINIFT